VQRRRLEKLTRSVSAETTFAAVAREFHAVKLNGWSKQYGERWIERMEKDLFPWIGGVPLKEITAPLLLQALRRIESRGAHETAHTLRQTAGQVFRYGVATGRCDANPAPHLYGALRPIIVKHMAAVLEPAAAGSLLRAIWAYEGSASDSCGVAAVGPDLSAARKHSGNGVARDRLRHRALTIPAAKMKRTVQGKESGRPHLVPLALKPLKSCARSSR
jgi:integrase